MPPNETPPGPVEGVPAWARPSLFQWLSPILHAVQHERYHSFSGTPSTAFVMLAERQLHIPLDWSGSERGAIENLAARMETNEDLFLQVLELAIDNVQLGYSFQDQDKALAALARILTEAGSVWRLDIQRLETGEDWHGHRTFRDVRTLQRRTSPEAALAVQHVAQTAAGAAPHLTSAWNHAFGRNPDPGRAYSEAVKAVEAAAIPVVSPNNAKATLGTVIAQLRATPQKWQVVLARDVPISARSPATPLEVVTNMAALLWGNQTDRHAPIQPVTQEQGEMAVHLALTLVQIFTRAVKLVP